MKKLLGLFSFVALLGANPGDQLSTDRRVAGVITDVEPTVVTIASSNHAVTGKIDATRTKVTVKGKPGTLRDLQISAHAKAELCLDDVWLRIDTH
jgi:hypothetical protein